MSVESYRVLGLPNNASRPEVRRAYRKLALKYHPDRNIGNRDAEDKFKEIAVAYAEIKLQMKEYYALLNLTPRATIGEIRSAYDALLPAYNQRANAGEQEYLGKMKDLKRAYIILTGNSEQSQSTQDGW